MKNYELLCIIKTNLDIDSVERVIKNIEDSVKNFGGNVLNTDKQGRKKLAYIIDGFRDGFYVTYAIRLPEKKVNDLKRYLKLNEDVIRNMLTVQSKVAAVAMPLSN